VKSCITSGVSCSGRDSWQRAATRGPAQVKPFLVWDVFAVLNVKEIAGHVCALSRTGGSTTTLSHQRPMLWLVMRPPNARHRQTVHLQKQACARISAAPASHPLWSQAPRATPSAGARDPAAAPLSRSITNRTAKLKLRLCCCRSPRMEQRARAVRGCTESGGLIPVCWG
jgi:hypothetical protein